MKRILSPHLLGLFPNANAGPRIQRYGDITGYWDIHTSSSSSLALFRRDQLPPCTIMSGDTCYDAAKHARLPPTGVTDSGLPRTFLTNFSYFINYHTSFLFMYFAIWMIQTVYSVYTQNEETLIFINIMEYKAFKVLKLWLEFKLATCWKHFLISPFYRSVGAASASIRYPGNYRQMLGLNTLIGRWRQCF